MTRWSPQHYRKQAQDLGKDPGLVNRAVATAQQVLAINPDLPPIFTLRHLAHLAQADYRLLRAIVARSRREPYRVFRVRKRASHAGERRFRVIAVPHPELMKVQRWITQRILAKVTPHAASVAFSKGNKLIEAARPHCGARWIIKLDVRNFFESITEIAVYRVFQSLGYQPLISLELARICTRMGQLTNYRRRERWNVTHFRAKIGMYRTSRMGHLPQGAPTSPMLANLAVRLFDEAVQEIADTYGYIFTRYADDITLSSRDPELNKARCAAVIGTVYKTMAEFGLPPNLTKTRIATPGARKIVLGLLVNGTEPRLPRDFRAMMRQHIYYLTKPNAVISHHAQNKGFVSITGMKHHLYGLAMFARQIEPAYGEKCLVALNSVKWPR
jgi:hypothetical protein